MIDYFKNKDEMTRRAKVHVERMYKDYSSDMADSIAHSVILLKDDCEKLERNFLKREYIDGSKIILQMCSIKDAIFEFESIDSMMISAVLNFASFKHPGGMFLKGSTAQEESLCHCSTLYPVLKYHSDFYERHQSKLHKGLYESEILYTPSIVFMNSKTVSLPYSDFATIEELKELTCNVLTCAAPNAGVARKNGVPEENITGEMTTRIRAILEFSKQMNVERLYLGAFGCGVFKNNSLTTALIFKECLRRYDFKEVIFPIPNRTTFMTFRSALLD